MTFIIKLRDEESTQIVLQGDRIENEQIMGFVCVRLDPSGELKGMFAQEMVASILVSP